MADNLVARYGNIILLIVCLGSIVDLFQFVWIIRRGYKKWQRSLYNKVKRDVLAAEFEKKNAS